MRKNLTDDVSVLQAALLGYQTQLETINKNIQDIRDRLRGREPSDAPPSQKRHRISPEGLARIAAAQRRRWAAKRKQAQQGGD
jgi:hypothetical protein